MILHSTITRYKRAKYNDDMYVNGEKRINKSIDVYEMSNNSTVDIDEIEARYDIFKFFAWYKVKRNLRQWKTSTDVKILRQLLLGYNPTEIATTLKISAQAVSQSRIKMYTLYKAWLKQLSLRSI